MPKQIDATAVWLLTDTALPEANVVLSPAKAKSETWPLAKTDGVLKGMYVYQNNGVNKSLGSWKMVLGRDR